MGATMRGTAIILIKGGAPETLTGSTYTIDLDTFEGDSVDEKARKILHLIKYMESNHMLDHELTREPVHEKLDELMEGLISIIREGN